MRGLIFYEDLRKEFFFRFADRPDCDIRDVDGIMDLQMHRLADSQSAPETPYRRVRTMVSVFVRTIGDPDFQFIAALLDFRGEIV